MAKSKLLTLQKTYQKRIDSLLLGHEHVVCAGRLLGPALVDCDFQRHRFGERWQEGTIRRRAADLIGCQQSGGQPQR